MENQDIQITCACGETFLWTVGDQEYYKERGFAPPKRCKECRAKKKAQMHENVQTRYAATCDECGIQTTVPFKPDAKRPVFCKTCYDKKVLGNRS